METNEIELLNFGKDHWSLLLYFETCAVDNKGSVNLQHMRINDKKRPFRNGSPFGWQDSYGTVVKDGTIPYSDHDDIDVMHELEKYNFCQNLFTDINPVIHISANGWQTVNELRKHKANGGNLNNFEFKF